MVSNKLPELGMMENGFERGKVDTTLFRKSSNKHFILVQIYVDGIIFGATLYAKKFKY